MFKGQVKNTQSVDRPRVRVAVLILQPDGPVGRKCERSTVNARYKTKTPTPTCGDTRSERCGAGAGGHGVQMAVAPLITRVGLVCHVVFMLCPINDTMLTLAAPAHARSGRPHLRPTQPSTPESAAPRPPRPVSRSLLLTLASCQ